MLKISGVYTKLRLQSSSIGYYYRLVSEEDPFNLNDLIDITYNSNQEEALSILVDSTILNFYKNLDEILSISDSLTSSYISNKEEVANLADSGNVNNHSYCDIFYVEPGYIGDYSTF